MNQNPEQLARDNIDKQLLACGCVIQDKKRINLTAGVGVAVEEYQTDVGPADYVLFIDKNPVGVIEAKREEEGHRLSIHEDQSTEYAAARLKYYSNGPLPFVYESTGSLTHFTDYRDPKPRARRVFTFHRPETFRQWLKEEHSLRFHLKNDIPSLGKPANEEELDEIARRSNLRSCQFRAIVNLEKSFADARSKALIQMERPAGKCVSG